MKNTEIYEAPEHYDRMFGSGYVDFWLTQAELFGAPILELGCGTGKLSIPLAERGHSVTGLDLVPSLLDYAKNRCPDTQWIQGDMRDFDIKTQYPLIMLPSNNIGHLHSVEDFQRCMSCVKKHLRPRGRFIIDTFVPNLHLLQRTSEDEFVLTQYEDPNGAGTVVVKARSTYNPATQVTVTQTQKQIPGKEPIEGTLNLKMYFPHELEALLFYNGFRVIDCFGGHEGQPFDNSSNFQVLICEAI